MPSIDYAAVKNLVLAEQALALLGWRTPYPRRGCYLRGPCLVHGSSSPSSRTFQVNVLTNQLYCHKCRWHGDQIDLAGRLLGLDVYLAAVELCRLAGVAVPHKSPRK